MKLQIEVSGSNIKMPYTFVEIPKFPCRLSVGDYIDLEGHFNFLNKEVDVDLHYKDIGFRVNAVAFLYDAEEGWYQKVFI